jgi:sugar phosphate isomerase/epimerase
MLRRTFLLAGAAAPALFGANKIDWGRISLLTDEIAKTPADAIAFAKQYAIRWVELRGLPGQGRSYFLMEPDELRSAAQELKDAGLKVSFLNTSMLKFSLPDTDPPRRTPETPEQKEKRVARDTQMLARRQEDLRKAIRAAQAFDIDMVRIFTFTRLAEPESVYQRVADLIGELALSARKEGIKLLIENEGSCNVATSAELAAMLKLVGEKNVGINWDPVNGMNRKEAPFPDGYKLLPQDRLWNVQMKARALVIGPDFIDWGAVYRALEADGYQGKVGLETHVFDGTLIEKSHLCMEAIRKIVAT